MEPVVQPGLRERLVRLASWTCEAEKLSAVIANRLIQSQSGLTEQQLPSHVLCPEIKRSDRRT